MSVAKFGRASFSGVLTLLGLLAVVMVANSGLNDLTDGRSYVTRQAPLHSSAPVVPSHSSRLFAWPTHGTSTYQRAARMARQGDPEAQRFVSRLGDVNPFDAQ